MTPTCDRIHFPMTMVKVNIDSYCRHSRVGGNLEGLLFVAFQLGLMNVSFGP